MTKSKKMIMIPEERWDKMLETYDALVLELEEVKKALKEAANSHKSQRTIGLEGGVK